MCQQQPSQDKNLYCTGLNGRPRRKQNADKSTGQSHEADGAGLVDSGQQGVGRGGTCDFPPRIALRETQAQCGFHFPEPIVDGIESAFGCHRRRCHGSAQNNSADRDKSDAFDRNHSGQQHEWQHHTDSRCQRDGQPDSGSSCAGTSCSSERRRSEHADEHEER